MNFVAGWKWPNHIAQNDVAACLDAFAAKRAAAELARIVAMLSPVLAMLKDAGDALEGTGIVISKLEAARKIVADLIETRGDKGGRG